MAKIISKALGTPIRGEGTTWIDSECAEIESVIPEQDPYSPNYDWEKDMAREKKIAQLAKDFFDLQDIEEKDAERESWEVRRA